MKIKFFPMAIIFLLSFVCNSAGQNKKIKEVSDPYTGTVTLRYEYFEDKDGSFIKDGFYKTWYKNGQIMESGFIKSNKKDGEWKEWYENGTLKAHYFLLNAELHGKSTQYYENGHIKQDMTYVNGKLDGTYRFYLKTGELFCEKKYIVGKEEGKAEFFGKNNKVNFIEEYKEGKKNGTWKGWNIETDELTKELTFVNDTCVTILGKWESSSKRRIMEFYNNGTMKMTTPMFEYKFGDNDPKSTEEYKYRINLVSLELLIGEKVFFEYEVIKVINDEMWIILPRKLAGRYDKGPSVEKYTKIR